MQEIYVKIDWEMWRLIKVLKDVKISFHTPSNNLDTFSNKFHTHSDRLQILQSTLSSFSIFTLFFNNLHPSFNLYIPLISFHIPPPLLNPSKSSPTSFFHPSHPSFILHIPLSAFTCLYQPSHASFIPNIPSSSFTSFSHPSPPCINFCISQSGFTFLFHLSHPPFILRIPVSINFTTMSTFA